MSRGMAVSASLRSVESILEVIEAHELNCEKEYARLLAIRVRLDRLLSRKALVSVVPEPFVCSAPLVKRSSAPLPVRTLDDALLCEDHSVVGENGDSQDNHGAVTVYFSAIETGEVSSPSPSPSSSSSSSSLQVALGPGESDNSEEGARGGFWVSADSLEARTAAEVSARARARWRTAIFKVRMVNRLKEDSIESQFHLHQALSTRVASLWRPKKGEAEHRPLLMLRPESTTKIAVESCVACVLLYLIITEPYRFGYVPAKSVHKETFWALSDNVVNAFILFDMVVSFRTGFVCDDTGREVLEPWRCARRYAGTWFLVDLVSAMPALLEHFIETNSAGLRAARVLKMGRAVKALKAIGMWETEVFSEVRAYAEDLESSMYSRAIARLVWVTMWAFMIAHYIACLAPLAGDGFFKAYHPYKDYDEHIGRGSLTKSAFEFSRWRQYTVAMYWAVTTITTVGYGDIVPHSDTERWFAIACQLVGGAFYGYVIAQTTAIAVSFDANNGTYYQKMDAIRSWMNHHNFGRGLRRKVRRSYKIFFTERMALDEGDILKDLEPNLQEDVSNFLLFDEIKRHPMFQGLPVGTRSKLVTVLRVVEIQRGKIIVKQDEPSSCMFVMIHGEALLTKNDATGQILSEKIRAGGSFGELLALGLETSSDLTAISQTDCEMYVLPSDKLLQAFASLPELLRKMRHDATIRRCNRQRSRSLRTDLVAPRRNSKKPTSQHHSRAKCFEYFAFDPGRKHAPDHRSFAQKSRGSYLY